MRLKYFFFTGLLLSTSIVGFCQGRKVDYNHQRAVAQLQKQTIYYHQEKNQTSRLSDYDAALYREMVKHATEQQWVELLSNNFVVTRAYALNALRDYYSETFISHALPMLRDHTRLPPNLGLKRDAPTLSSTLYFWLWSAMDARVNGHASMMRFKMNEEDEEKVIEILVKDTAAKIKKGTHLEINREALSHAMRKWAIDPRHSEKLIFLAEAGFDEALIPLAFWENESAMALLIERFEKGEPSLVLAAVAKWPHPKFRTGLNKIFAEKALGWTGEKDLLSLYRAAFAFGPDQTYEWVVSILNRSHLIPETIDLHVRMMRRAFYFKYPKNRNAPINIIQRIARFEKAANESKKPFSPPF